MSETPEKSIETNLADQAPGDAAEAPSTPEVPIPTAEERIALLEAEKAEIKDRMLRVAADFENYKKRARKDQVDGEARAKEMVLRDFLEIADNLERATGSWRNGKDADAKSIQDGVDLVLRQFRSKLERYQVRMVEALGQVFDPRFHEAISQTPSADVAPGSVVHELQKGYVIGDKLLRPAMVVVAVAPAAGQSAEPAKASDESTQPSDRKD